MGASAGLCLLMDQFRYDYRGMTVGSPDAPVLLECTPLGDVSLPSLGMPRIVWRTGLDISPVDVRREDEAKWLLACVWPDHARRRHRLEAAIELSRRNPPVVVRGDLVDDLPRLIEGAPASATLVVFHSAVLPYVSPEHRVGFTSVLARESHRRPIVWISNEGPGVIPERDALAPARDHLRFRVGRARWWKGRTEHELLALAHYHGWDLEWLQEA